MDSITFMASFPPIQSALKVNGIRDGMRIQLDVPESEMATAVHLLAWREVPLEVTVRQAQFNKVKMGDGEKQHDNQARRGQKSRWQTPKVAGLDGDSGAGWQPDDRG